MTNTTWDIDISDTYDTQTLDAWPIAPIDYTAEIPHPVPDEEWHAEQEPEYIGCECEIDWKCGVCRENGYSHSRLDACGLGPDADLAGIYLGEFR